MKSTLDDKGFLNDLLKLNQSLVPYDCDANFEPCNKNGLKAHWTLVTGFILPVRVNESLPKSIVDLIDELKTNEKNNETLFIELKDFNLTEEQIENLTDFYQRLENFNWKKNIWTFCKQGKCKSSGVWNLAKLIESNQQLKQVNDSKCNVENFIRPEDGNLENVLSSRYIVFNN